MITKEQVERGFKTGAVKIIKSPYGDGIVCQIGENWFYFAGYEGEHSTPEEYLACVPEEDIVSEIFSVLDEMLKTEHELLRNEYRYFEQYLSTHCAVECVSKPEENIGLERAKGNLKHQMVCVRNAFVSYAYELYKRKTTAPVILGIDGFEESLFESEEYMRELLSDDMFALYKEIAYAVGNLEV